MTPRSKGALALAVALAVPAEGLRQYAYYDPPGILTVCYGTTGRDVVPSIRAIAQGYRIAEPFDAPWLPGDMLCEARA